MKQQFWRSSVICTLLLCLAAGFNSCKKDTDPQDDDGNGGGNGGGGASSVKITGYTPQKPMWGDVIEITGESFAAKVEDVEVWFPGMYTQGNEAKGEVLEASPTKLKVRTRYNTEQRDGYEYPTANSATSSIVVKVKGKNEYSTEQDYIQYRAVPFINAGNGIRPETGGTGAMIRPGEKFQVIGKGFGITKTEGILKINGVEVTIDSVWGNEPQVFGEGNTNMMATLPLEVAKPQPGGVQGQGQQDYTVEYSRSGRSYARKTRGHAMPLITISGNTLKGLYNSADHITDFTITGENLYPTEIQFRSTAAGGPNFTVAVTGAGLGAKSVTAFVPLALMFPYGGRQYSVRLYEPTMDQGFSMNTVIYVTPN